jgi:predicted metal-dependent HD superfamily phosphohydrolase
MIELKATFTTLAGQYTGDQALISELWKEIALQYSAPGRHYHSLSHLENLLEQISAVRDAIEDRETVLFALYYHDVIYDALRSDNEEKSAELALVRLRQIGYPDDRAQRCERHILATKGHSVSDDNDTNLFTDADLSILGSAPEAYQAYSRQVRAEYAAYPDQIYAAGRRRVLERLLAMPRIFKSDFFFERFEAAARQNLTAEMNFFSI